MTRSQSTLAMLGVFLFVLVAQIPANYSKDKSFEKELLRIARDYKDWGRVDDEVRWAPELCRIPMPGRPYFSASKDADTHGQKLYSLFAKNRNEYVRPGKATEVAVGQIVVKQSWVVEETQEIKPGEFDRKRVEHADSRPLRGDSFYPYVTKGGKVFKANKPAGLFVMMKLDPKTEGTDNGWVYGTLSADGKSVTAVGKIESCMKCHVDAKHDRLFGLQAK